MPVYAYACNACGNAFDARQSFDEPALTTCEVCGGALRKQYGSIGVSFNGPGFYRTDSRASVATDASGSSSTSDGGSKADGGSKGGSESGSKSDGGSKPSPNAATPAKTPTTASSGASQAS